MNRPTPLTWVSSLAGGVVVERLELLEVEPSVQQSRGEVVQVDGLRSREAHAAQRLRVDGEQLHRSRQPAALHRVEPAEDRGGRRE